MQAVCVGVAIPHTSHLQLILFVYLLFTRLCCFGTGSHVAQASLGLLILPSPPSVLGLTGLQASNRGEIKFPKRRE